MLKTDEPKPNTALLAVRQTAARALIDPVHPDASSLDSVCLHHDSSFTGLYSFSIALLCYVLVLPAESFWQKMSQ